MIHETNSKNWKGWGGMKNNTNNTENAEVQRPNSDVGSDTKDTVYGIHSGYE